MSEKLRALWPGNHPPGRRRRLLIGAWIAGAVVLIAATDLIVGTPRASEIRTLARVPRATEVYDINGKMAFTIFAERRIEVPLSEVSPNLIHAVLAIEDQRFMDHAGFDPWRIAGAFVANIRHGETVQGGSTITQQLARKSFLSDDRTIRRKLKELLLAIRIERAFTKDQILEMYLNRVYFGDGYYGIEAASRGYFGKPAKALSVEESALLAGLIKAPSAYAPTDHLDRAVARRAVVLKQMVDAGYLDPAAEAGMEHAPVTLVDGFGHEHTGQYFKNQITRLLIDRFGWETVSKGGLRVYSTLDSRAQEAADTALSKGLDAIEKSAGYRHPRRGDPRTLHAGEAPDYLQGALVSIDPSSGEVRAMTGGRDFDESQFNRAMQAERQPGSAFKPIVYAAALEAGYSPATLITGLDTPMMVPAGPWLPEDHSTADSMTMRTGLRTSSNRAALQVLRAVGIPTAVSYAERLGLEAPPVPSLVLGSGDVTVLSMASAYGVFANGGWLRTPTFIRKVEDHQGRLLYQEKPESRRAISEETAFLMAQMLSDVISAGTGYRAREAGFKFPAAGKTGTTNDFHDAWFIGFTPDLVTSVWVGFDKPKTIAPGAYAASMAAPIWGRYMQAAAGDRNGGWIDRPGGIVAVQICRLSGALPTDMCRRSFEVADDGSVSETSYVGTEYFRRGTEPTELCPIHGDPMTPRNPRSIIGSGYTRPALPPPGVTPPPVPAPFPRAAVRVAPPVSPAVATDQNLAIQPPPAPPVVSATPSPTSTPAASKGFFSKMKKIFTKDPPPPKGKPSGRSGG
ncbi:MAG TPA: PBP1A family penicillin-binding protein [Vicinamibacterales bacterium]|nr:PBP1A family penicillin-binding protein [Vicinamibacterales bacterium]